MHHREAGEKGKKILFLSSPAHFLFFHYCHFYRNTQREIRRRREPNVGFLILATGGSKTIQPIACVAGSILVPVVFSFFSAAEPVREASGEAARANLASYGRRLRPYGKRVAPLRLPTPCLTSKSRPLSSGPLLMANIVSSLRKGEWGYGARENAHILFPLFLNFQKSATQVNVKVIWASPYFGHSHFQNSRVMNIPCNSNPNPNPNPNR